MKKLNVNGASWDSIFLTFVKFVTTLISIILTKILSSYLSLTEYGTYSEANIIISIGASIIMLGLGDALNYYYNKKTSDDDNIDKRKIVNTIFLIEIIIGISFALIVILGRNLIINYFSNELLKFIIIIISIKPMLDNIIYLYQILYVSVGKAKIIALRNLIISILKLITLYCTVRFFNDVTLVFLVLIILDILQIIFFKIHFGKNMFFVNPLKSSKKQVFSIIKYGIPMGIYAMTNVLIREIDKLVISRVSSTEMLAIYANCSKVLPFDIVAISFATVLIPYIMSSITSNQKEKGLEIFKNYIKIGYYSAWILGFAVLITNEQAISFLYSNEYLSGKYIFIVYIIDSMIKFASMHLILTANKNTKELMSYSIISLVINLILNIALYYWLGTIGPAIATVIVSIIYTFMTLRKSIKILDASWKDIFKFKEIGVFLLSLCITGLVVYTFNKFLLNNGLNKNLTMIISMILFSTLNLVINCKGILKSLKFINIISTSK